MYCRKCGAQNHDNAYSCVSCGEPLQNPSGVAASPQKIPNYLVQSILVTLFCCLPLGIASIVYAAQVNGKVQAGDIQGAMESSRKAKLLSWWSFGLGLVGGILYVVLMIVAETSSY